MFTVNTSFELIVNLNELGCETGCPATCDTLGVIGTGIAGRPNRDPFRPGQYFRSS
jgi:hypothetical protein